VRYLRLGCRCAPGPSLPVCEPTATASASRCSVTARGAVDSEWFPVLTCGEMAILRVGNSLIIAGVNCTGRKGSIQMANGSSFSLLRFVVRVFSDRRPSLLAMCLGLQLFPGCALLQRPSDIALPTETPAQPAAPKTSVGVQPAPSQPVPPTQGPAMTAKLPQTGEASWYGAQHQGKQTASGTIYDQAGLTAAHPSLPFGSKIKVTNIGNGKSVEVEVTDRGPFAENRIIDLSQAAAKALDMIDSGTATVRLELSSGQ